MRDLLKRIRNFYFRSYSVREFNLPLLIAVLVLTLVGLAVIGSANPDARAKQIVGIVLGMAALLVLSVTDYIWIQDLYWFLYGGLIFVLLFVLLFGETYNGAKRWIAIGTFTFQPSELAKIIMILWAARFVMVHRRTINKPSVLLQYFALAGVPLALIYTQPDLSTTISIAIVLLVILFMGGIIPTYIPQGARVQVAYMTEFWSTTPVREHEKLDGLWTDGLRTYPVCGNFKDVYVETLADAEKKYHPEELTSFVKDCLERFEPQVVVTHDFNGEYGHGFHQITAKAVANALEESSYQVPKAYFHLYPENKLHMDLRVPIDSMGGKTALDVAKDAYLQHKSQQWCWFYVSDTYKYSVADFGLYRTTVGEDETGSMLDHLVLRAEQERIAEEERRERERLEQERLEQEQAQALERAKLEEFDRQAAALQREAEEKALKASDELLRMEKELKAARTRTAVIIAGGVVLLLLLAGFVLLRRKIE